MSSTACNWSAMATNQQRRCPSMSEREIETCCRPRGPRTSPTPRHGELRPCSTFSQFAHRRGSKKRSKCLRREHGRNKTERIVGGKTQQQVRTSDVALQFEFLLMAVVCGIGEQTQDGSNDMAKQITPSSCDSQVCITNLLDATKMLQMMCCAKKIFVALAWNMCNRGHRGSEHHQPYNMCRTRTGTEKHTVTVTFSNYNPHQIEWNPIGSCSASSGSGRSSREQPRGGTMFLHTHAKCMG